MREQRSRHIVFPVYEGVSLLHLAGPLEAFHVADAFSAVSERSAKYGCTVVSTRGGRVMTADGVELNTKAARGREGPNRYLPCAGGFLVEDVTRDRVLVQWIWQTAPGFRRVSSVCVGSFLLAEAGILESRRAVTYWMHASLLASRYPAVHVEPDAIFVRDGRVWISAGVTSGIDLALALIELDAGRKVAIDVGRVLVVYLKRAGGQSQYSALLTAQAQSDSDTFTELEQWIAEHLKGDLRVEALEEQVVQQSHLVMLWLGKRRK
jgi:transcriptional regulator GlxA family with amidase domain